MPLANNQYRPTMPLIRFLDTNGDGTGTTLATGDYSATPTAFYIQPPANEIYVISELVLHYSASGNFKADTYGSGLALINGVQIYATRNAVTVLDITNGHPVTTNDEWMHLGSNFQFVQFSGPQGSLSATFNSQAFGTDFRLNGQTNDQLVISLNDDFTGLIDQHFVVHGFV